MADPESDPAFALTLRPDPDVGEDGDDHGDENGDDATSARNT